MDLLDQLRNLAEAIASHPPQDMLDPSGVGLGLSTGGEVHAEDIAMGIAALIESASDADLLAAHQRAAGEPQSYEAGALTAEVERRGLSLRPDATGVG